MQNETIKRNSRKSLSKKRIQNICTTKAVVNEFSLGESNQVSLDSMSSC